MKHLSTIVLTVLFLCQFNFDLSAQLAPGSTAPDFTVTDINGNTHNLYSELDNGKYVFIVFSATWCGPCWNFHQSGTMETMYNTYGPPGTDEARVYYIESDLNTPLSCIYGNCSNTHGDWTAGTNFPIVNLSGSNEPGLAGAYNISYFPTVYAICPDKRIYETGQISASDMETYMTSCDMMESSIVTMEENCYGDGNGFIDIEIEGGVSPVNYNWSNGSSSQDLNGIPAGNYTVTMTDDNNVSYSTTINLSGPTSTVEIVESSLDLDLDCHGENNGVVHIDPIGGTPSYEAVWDDGSTAFERNDLAGGTHSVTVTDFNGCTQSNSYTVVEPPLLTLALDKLDASCGLSNGFISAESDGGTGQHTYDIGQGSTYNPLFPDLFPGNYTVTVTDNNGCTEFESIEINNIPGPEAVAPANVTLDCEGSTLEIDATASNPGSGTNIMWTTTDGNIVSGETTLTPTVDATGTYTLTLSNPQTCSDEAETVVNPNPDQPVADAGDDTEVNCIVQEVTIGSNNSSSGPNIEYSWEDENGNEVGTTQFIDVSSSGEYTLFVTNTDINCTASSVVMVENTGGSVEAQASAEGMLTCNESSVQLNSDGSSNGPGIIFSWVNSEGMVIGTEPTIEVENAGNYTLIVTDTVEECSSEQTITVEQDIEAPEIEIDGEKTLTCDQSEIELNIAPLNGDFSINWIDEVGEVIGNGNSVMVNSPGEYTVEVTNNVNGCSSEATVTVVNDENLPVAKVETPPILSCIIDEVLLDGSASSQGSKFSYSWSTEDGNIPGASDEISIIVDEAGTYTLTVTNLENGCQNSFEVVVEKYEKPPSANINLSADLFLINVSADIQGPYNDILWDFGDGNTSTEFNATHLYRKVGSYEVCLTLNNDCGDTTYCTTVEVSFRDIYYDENFEMEEPVSPLEPLNNEVGVQKRGKEVSAFQSFAITPNPSSDVVYVNWTTELAMDVEMRITDLAGKLLYTKSYDGVDAIRERLPVESWNKGIYLVQMISKENVRVIQMVKQ